MSQAVGDRIHSMDQFRGYAVSGMILVTLLAGQDAIHPVLKHYRMTFSYADSVLPSFLFACGFSYRLTILRRLRRGALRTYEDILVRGLALVFLSLILCGLGVRFGSWGELVSDRGKFVAKLIKVDLWEVLAIIGTTQIFIMPVIAASARVRACALVLCAVVHPLISSAFNFDFVYGHDNRLDSLLGTAGKVAHDGGCFGIIAWSIPMLAGTLTYDLVASCSAARAALRLLRWAAVLMALGYGLSCLATPSHAEARGSTVAMGATGQLASSPAGPPAEDQGRGLSALLAPPPFARLEHGSERARGYWAMNKRVVSDPYALFATGFALGVYALFVWVCDVRGRQVGFLRTFGQNSLAAYALHHLVAYSVLGFVPTDSPLWWCLVAAVAFFGVTYVLVRYLERHEIHLRI